jgi:predicted nucleic acid-binding protein
MIVTADATPLNYFVLIGQAGILSALFGQVVIPPAVASELQRPRAPELVRAWMTSPPPWLEVRSIARPKTDDLDYLGAGEREAILLAEEIHADWLIIDDYEGRLEANRRMLPVIGTLRVLDEAAERQLINLPEVIAKLQKTTFYLSPDLLQWLLDRHAGRQKRV